MRKRIHDIVSRHISVQQAVLADERLLQSVADAAASCVQCLRNDGKVLFAGNGGSAADAQHLAAELSGRFYLDREPLYAEAMHVNTSFLTAVANDYNFDEAFARMVRAMGRRGDVFFAISTSGNSPNILRAAEDARTIGLTVVGMTGASGGRLAALTDHLINIPSTDTPRIQEGYMLLGHALCELVEAEMFGNLPADQDA